MLGSMSTKGTAPWVIIVGAGSSGLLLALLLAKRGITVQVVDMSSKLDEQPRATHFAPPAIHELRRAGVIDEVREQGFIPGSVGWRKFDCTYIAGIDNTVMESDDDKLVCIPLHRLGKIVLRHPLEQPTAQVSWNHKVLDVGQDADSAWIDVETPTGNQRLYAAYVAGCDGANSQVRRALFGKSFPGKTWDEQIVATNVCKKQAPGSKVSC
jgi:2-polyprenyl-6-methoxyphenol hydroxylase-like FAD-dependent oxidoreductase